MCKRLKIVPKPGHVLFIGTHNRICARRRALSATIIASESFKFVEIYADALVVYLIIAVALFALFAVAERVLKRRVPVRA